MAHVFISYKHDDGDSAELIKDRLEKEGLETWIDSDIQGGEKWSPAIDRAIENSFALIVVMSPEARKSEYITYEWSFALGMGKPIIPIMLRQTDLHPKLAEFQYIDFTNRAARPWSKLFDRLKKSSEQQQDSPEQVGAVDDGLEDAAIRTLVMERDNSAIPALLAGLLDPEVSVRTNAIAGLARIGNESAILGIVDAALKDSDHAVRIVAVDALGNFHSSIAVSGLLRALQDKTGYVRAHAAKSLGNIGDARSISALTKRLNDDTKTVRRFAANALEKIGTPKALAALEQDHEQQDSSNSTQTIPQLLENTKDLILALGDDVQLVQQKRYIACKRNENFVSIVPTAKNLKLYLKLNPDDIALENDFTRDVRSIGHWGTGDVELTIKNNHDLKRAKLLIFQSYNLN